MKRILVCDDALFMRVHLKMILERNGFEVVGEAENGQVGYELYQQLKPDLVTMDITMPIMNGLEALRAIRTYDDQAKVIMISAVGNESNMVESIKLGAKTFILKPFDEAMLIHAIQKVLGMEGTKEE